MGSNKSKLHDSISIAVLDTIALAKEALDQLITNPDKFRDTISKVSNLASKAHSLHREMSTTYSQEELSNQKGDVHTSHCCIYCGCKYGDDREIESAYTDEPFVPCTVVSKAKKQSYPCKGDCIH